MSEMSKHSKKGYSFQSSTKFCTNVQEDMTLYYLYASGSISYSLLVYQVYWPATNPSLSNVIKIDLEQKSNALNDDVLVSATLKLLANNESGKIW